MKSSSTFLITAGLLVWLMMIVLFTWTIPSHADTAVTTATTSVPANTNNTVVIPFGDWINAIAPTVIEIAGAVITVVVAWAVQYLPAFLRGFVGANITAQVEQVLDRAIDWAVAQVAGASRDKEVTIPVGNAMVASALSYVITHAPEWLVKWMGGAAAIEQKILARISTVLPSDSAVSTSMIGNRIVPATPPVAGGTSGPLAGPAPFPFA